MTPKIKILKGGLDFEGDQKAHLWHFAPRWPGTHPKAYTAQDLQAKIQRAYDLAYKGGHLILWMPSTQLHKTAFNPLSAAAPWKSIGTVISGASPISIGFIYARDPQSDRGCKLILDTQGHHGPSSSLTMRWLVEQFCVQGGPVCDPYAHRSAQLAQWCRRRGISYQGHIRGKANRESARKILAQIELPGIQIQLL